MTVIYRHLQHLRLLDLGRQQHKVHVLTGPASVPHQPQTLRKFSLKTVLVLVER